MGPTPFEPPADAQGYDAWFRANVLQALADGRHDVEHEDAEAESTARRRLARSPT